MPIQAQDLRELLLKMANSEFSKPELKKQLNALLTPGTIESPLLQNADSIIKRLKKIKRKLDYHDRITPSAYYKIIDLIPNDSNYLDNALRNESSNEHDNGVIKTTVVSDNNPGEPVTARKQDIIHDNIKNYTFYYNQSKKESIFTGQKLEKQKEPESGLLRKPELTPIVGFTKAHAECFSTITDGIVAWLTYIQGSVVSYQKNEALSKLTQPVDYLKNLCQSAIPIELANIPRVTAYFVLMIQNVNDFHKDFYKEVYNLTNEKFSDTARAEIDLSVVKAKDKIIEVNSTLQKLVFIPLPPAPPRPY